MSDRIDFSANAPIYDRRHGAALSANEVLRLRAVANLEPSGIVLDVGAGTGRVALPLAASGIRVVALEPASGMAAQLREKARSSPTYVVAAEGEFLPFADAAEEWVMLREGARRMFEGAGVKAPFHPGVRTENEVEDALTGFGLIRTAQLSFGAGPMITLREFVRRIVDGELSYTWRLPETVRAECLPSLERWAEDNFDLDRQFAVPADIRWSVYEKQKK